MANQLNSHQLRSSYIQSPFRVCDGRGHLRSRSVKCHLKEQSTSNDINRTSIHRRELIVSTGILAGLNVVLPIIPLHAVAAEKKENMPIDELKNLIVKDFQENQYYITGKLTPEVFEDDCIFTDPTTRVQGTEYYAKAVASLFDPDTSRADLISIQVRF
jgi:hypothetical protein